MVMWSVYSIAMWMTRAPLERFCHDNSPKKNAYTNCAIPFKSNGTKYENVAYSSVVSLSNLMNLAFCFSAIFHIQREKQVITTIIRKAWTTVLAMLICLLS